MPSCGGCAPPGGTIACSCRAESVIVRDGRAEGVVSRDGRTIKVRRAVADVPVTSLYGGLVPWPEVPDRLRDNVRCFHRDRATFKTAATNRRRRETPYPARGEDRARAGGERRLLWAR